MMKEREEKDEDYSIIKTGDTGKKYISLFPFDLTFSKKEKRKRGNKI